MHDPMTLAFKIPRPWPSRRHTIGGKRYWPEWIQIWHVDPEKGGDDDSCDWFGGDLTRENGWYPGTVDEFNHLSPAAQEAVRFVWWQWRQKLTARRWWQHPRWHLRHWQINVLPLQAFKRWAFSRCAVCGKRFSWRECATGQVIGTWDGKGPQWFGGENITHMRCSRSKPVEAN